MEGVSPSLRRVLVVLLTVLVSGLLVRGLLVLARLYGYQSNDANLPLTALLTLLLAGVGGLLWRWTRPPPTYTLDDLLGPAPTPAPPTTPTAPTTPPAPEHPHEDHP
jgi:hypothetical protein